MILLVLLSFILIAGYVYAMIKKGKEIPYSISATYYALTHKFWFALCMIGSGVLLLPTTERNTRNWLFSVLDSKAAGRSRTPEPIMHRANQNLCVSA